MPSNVGEIDPYFDGAVLWIAGPADKRDNAGEFFVGLVLWANFSCISDLELGRDGVGHRGLHYHFAHIADCEQFAARRGVLTLELELISNDAREGRANRRVAQLSLERCEPFLCLLEPSLAYCAVVGVHCRRVQSRGGFSEPQIVFSGCQSKLRSFDVLLRNSTLVEESLASLVKRPCIG